MSNQVNERKITYRQVGDYQIPNIILPPEERNVEIGIWGMLFTKNLYIINADKGYKPYRHFTI